MQYLDDLFFWINERERIRKLKESGAPRPWTLNPILHANRFCNVERENDRVTIWIMNNWILPNVDSNQLAFGATMGRMVNLPSTLAELKWPSPWDPTSFVSTLACLKANGVKVWTSAYMITGGYSEGGESKEVIIARVLSACHERLQKDPVRRGDTLAQAAEKIKSLGIGTFLSAQVVADLKHTSLLSPAKDWTTWCAPGPGSTMGLNFLHGRDPLGSVSPTQFINEVNVIRELLGSAGVHLCAQNTQNCLCEFSKYVRAKHFGKRLKSGYVPDTRPL